MITRAAAAALVCAAALSMAVAQAEPSSCPAGYTPDGAACIARLTAVTADGANGTLTGTPIGGTTPVTVFGEPSYYLPSAGFGSAAPDLVRQWDVAVAGASSPADPGWYGEGKGRAFLPRQLNELAARMPSGTVVVRGVPDELDADIFELQSIQPVA